MRYLKESRRDGTMVLHGFESEAKYRFFADGMANTVSRFIPCAEEEARGFAAMYLHPCGGPRRLVPRA